MFVPTRGCQKCVYKFRTVSEAPEISGVAPDAAQLAGRTLTRSGTVRVFLFDETPYMHLPGAGDVLMFPTGKDTFTTRAAPGLGIAFERGPNDKVTTVTLTLSGRTLRAFRAQPQ